MKALDKVHMSRSHDLTERFQKRFSLEGIRAPEENLDPPLKLDYAYRALYLTQGAGAGRSGVGDG